MQMPEVAGNLGPDWGRGPQTDGDMGMFRKPDRLEPALFARAGQVIGAHGIIRSKHGDSQFHRALLGVKRTARTLPSAMATGPLENWSPAVISRSSGIVSRPPCRLKFQDRSGSRFVDFFIARTIFSSTEEN